MRRTSWLLASLVGIASTAACGGAYDRGGGAGGAAATKGSGRACEYEGSFHGDGESFPAADGCNSCSCDDGTVDCTLITCNSCADIQRRWSEALQAAKQCNAQDEDSCGASVVVGAPCACDTFVSRVQREAIANLQQAEAELQASSCFGPVACEPCLPPTSGSCSAEGVCVDDF